MSIDEKLAGEEGFEPSYGCTKNSCLTTWRLPNLGVRNGRVAHCIGGLGVSSPLGWFGGENPGVGMVLGGIGPKKGPGLARPQIFWCWRSDSNRRPTHYECAALPTELHQRPTGF